MKVLWFEVTPPSKYCSEKTPIAGWQDALEEIVSKCSNIELYVSFESYENSGIKKIDNITYIPFKINYTRMERIKNQWTYNVYKDKVLSSAFDIIKTVNPDLIHVFGNEWPFGLIAETINIPVVVHIQGSIVPYTNAYFPPGYNYLTICRYAGLSIRKYLQLYKSYKRNRSRLMMEYKIWNAVQYYMGRTCWDKSLVMTLSQSSFYYHVDEALRNQFINTNQRWSPIKDGKVRLVTTGLTTFWKGPDMLLKTAHILKLLGLNFEWNVIGTINSEIKRIIERKEKTTFEENNVYILGMKRPNEVIKILCSSMIYVHTAYIENSPNSICEAQYLGLPIISTHVGGIETLLSNGNDGVLVPANDPWRMASEIILLSKNDKKMLDYSTNSIQHARKRHNPQKILSNLLTCYEDILNRQKK